MKMMNGIIEKKIVFVIIDIYISILIAIYLVMNVILLLLFYIGDLIAVLMPKRKIMDFGNQEKAI